MIRASKKARERNAIIKQLDGIARTRCFERDGYKCVRCNTDKGIQWAHVKTRGLLALRWDEWNHLTLCGGCHMFWWHKFPDESGPWFKETYPDRWEHLQVTARLHLKVELKALLAGMKHGEAL